MRRRGNSCGTELGIGARTGVTGVTGDRSSDVEGETGGEATGSGMERARDSRQDAVRRMGGSWRGLVWEEKGPEMVARGYHKRERQTSDQSKTGPDCQATVHSGG